MFKIGLGYDVHRLVPDRKLILGGVEIPHELGLLGHSDADVLIHALIDALLGALALGDIGLHFPDTDPQYKGADSRALLRHVFSMVIEQGFRIGNLDATICAERPKLKDYIVRMRRNIATDLGCDIGDISVKATTEEGLGISGAEQGMSATCIVLLYKV
ncbi:MAG: 2-C-methyl-D-erythritol 2,4-cyclodiphosphate synthase [Candidatus Cloacimonetes bacterium HGW-Cloacimonetes-1]|jgi:2-C-methyl-D-erythritol 2,4-cyclodiphosphate synthase|nr:MAG: 2-C-methyl-D-erythritol 2,4-cyclodiphosphate synthase [Candidatus Cloacimonetes bacterium HGW-Cloacimonetes-1]